MYFWFLFLMGVGATPRSTLGLFLAWRLGDHLCFPDGSKAAAFLDRTLPPVLSCRPKNTRKCIGLDYFWFCHGHFHHDFSLKVMFILWLDFHIGKLSAGINSSSSCWCLWREWIFLAKVVNKNKMLSLGKKCWHQYWNFWLRFIFWCLGPHLTVCRAYSWPVLRNHLLGSGGTVCGTRGRPWVLWKANALLAVLLLWHLYSKF